MIVSLFVLTGYGADVFDVCCAGEKQEQASHGKSDSGKKAPLGERGCHCLCHQIYAGSSLECPSLAPTALQCAEVVRHGDEFPPEAVPLGIDYPPQLA